jgi:uncharacterized membrane protein
VAILLYIYHILTKTREVNMADDSEESGGSKGPMAAGISGGAIAGAAVGGLPGAIVGGIIGGLVGSVFGGASSSSNDDE